MAWQLWVAIGAIATGLIAIVAVWLHRAQEVFDRIVDEPRTDDLTKHRQRHPLQPRLSAPSAHPPHRSATDPVSRRAAKRQT
jgi:hypothetical protein